MDADSSSVVDSYKSEYLSSADQFCYCPCPICCGYYIDDEDPLDDYTSGISYNRKSAYAEKVKKRIKVLNGTIDRDFDLIHTTKRDFNVTEERERQLIDDPFGMQSFDVTYSIGKHKRWQICKYFEKNCKEFQHPAQNISTVMIISDELKGGLNRNQCCCSICRSPPGYSSKYKGLRVKRVIAGGIDGNLSVKESKNGQAYLVDLLKSLESLKQKNLKHKNASHRRKMARKVKECQDELIRINYFVSDPNPTSKQYEWKLYRRRNDYFYAMKSQKVRSRLILPEDLEYYEDSFDYESECDSEEIDYIQEKPRGFTLADYIIQDEDDFSSFVYLSSSNSIEDFEFIEQESRRNSIDSYEMVDLD